MYVNVQVKGVEELLKKFDAKKVGKGIQAALNRSVKSGKTEASEMIRQIFAIKKSDLDRKITIQGAWVNKLSATLTVIGKPINLLYFNARQITGSRSIKAKRKGRISADTQLKTGRAGRGYSGVTSQIQLSHKTVLPKAFISRATKGGIPLVLVRSKEIKSRSGRKEGLRAVKVITEASIFKQGRVMEKVIAKIKTQFNKEWDNQVKQLQSGQGWMEK